MHSGIAPPQPQVETAPAVAARLSPSRRLRWTLLAAALLIALIASLLFEWRAHTIASRSSQRSQPIAAATVAQVRLSGKTQAVRSRAILAPVLSGQQVGTLTIVKENSPTSFVVEQNLQTMPGAKTLTFDSKTGHILLIAAETAPAPAGGTGRPQMVPDSFTIIVVGK